MARIPLDRDRSLNWLLRSYMALSTVPGTVLTQD